MISLHNQTSLKMCSLLLLIMFLPVLAKAETYTTPEGHLFEVNLVPDKTEIIVGEPLYLTFEITNLSDVDLSFWDGGDYRNRLGRPLSYKVNAVRDDGKEVPVPEILYSFGGLAGYHKVPKTGGKDIIRLFLPLWASFEEAGNYKITCQKSLGIHNSKTPNEIKNTFEGIPVNVETNLKVLPRSDNAMKKVVSFWGDEIFSKDSKRSYEAVNVLQYIGGQDVIDPFVTAAESSEKPFALEAVVRSLAGFDEKRAFRAIISQKSHKLNGVRSAVADALAISKNPDAFDYLQEMENDPDGIVRVSVIDAFGKIGTPEAIKEIKEMMKEPRNKDLSYYANFYLEKAESNK